MAEQERIDIFLSQERKETLPTLLDFEIILPLNEVKFLKMSLVAL